MEYRQGLFGQTFVFHHFFMRIANAVESQYKGLDILFCLRGVEALVVSNQGFRQSAYLGSLTLRRSLERDDKRQGGLAVTYVVHRRLTQILGVGIVEYVVLDLEAESQLVSKFTQRTHLTLATRCRFGSGFAACCKEPCRLLLDDAYILRFVDPHRLILMQLEYLARRERTSQVGDDTQYLGISDLGYQSDHLGQHIVTGQHCHLVRPVRMHCLLAATGRRVIHYVVMHQARCVQQFQGYCRADRLVGNAVAKTCRLEHQNRTQLLAALRRNIAKHVIEQVLLSRQTVGELPIVGA